MAQRMIMWVNDTITVLAGGEDRPIQGVLVDQHTYFKGVFSVSAPDKKIHHGSTKDVLPLRPGSSGKQCTCGELLGHQ